MERLERPIDAELVVDRRNEGVDSQDQVARETYCQTGISDHFRSSVERLGDGVGVRQGTETERRRLKRRLSQDAFGPRYVRIKGMLAPWGFVIPGVKGS